jgi:hypothetical protein
MIDIQKPMFRRHQPIKAVEEIKDKKTTWTLYQYFYGIGGLEDP